MQAGKRKRSERWYEGDERNVFEGVGLKNEYKKLKNSVDESFKFMNSFMNS